MNPELFFPDPDLFYSATFLEFRIRIHEEILDPTGSGFDPNYLKLVGKFLRKCLTINQKEESTN